MEQLFWLHFYSKKATYIEHIGPSGKVNHSDGQLVVSSSIVSIMPNCCKAKMICFNSGIADIDQQGPLG